MVRSKLSEAPEASPSNQTMTMSHLSLSIFSYNINLLLASIISLLLVILFVLLLHIYAKWLLLQARRRRRIRTRTSSLSGLLQGFHRFQTFSSFHAAACPMKGLDPSLVASIPIFLYKRNPAGLRDDGNDSIREDLGLECVICLSDFEEDDIGRALAKCGHAFHSECIEAWLHSHTTCPICRAHAASVHEGSQGTDNDDAAVIDMGGNGGSSTDRDEEEGGVASVVMDVFIVSVSVSRAGSSRRTMAEEDA